MNVNLSSLSPSYGSTRTTQTQRAGPSAEDKAKMFADMDSDGDGSVTKSEFEAFKPPEAPSQFNVQRSTSQLAQQSGHGGPPGGPGGAGGPPPGPPPGGMGGPGGAGGDPIQSLDTDSDGSVSSDEFGLDEASDEVKALYAAIDSDSDGALSTDEISGFREQMQAQMGPPPMGPPPQGASNSSTGTRSSQRPDASEMIRMIAARYAETQSSTPTESLSLTA
jgi:Ca2+-binding EF-hand superfamily protein